MALLDSEDLALPPAVRARLDRLTAHGHDAWIVGESLHDMLRGERPERWTAATSASPAAIADCFATAVPVRPGAAVFVVPGLGGPLDLASHRNGASVEHDLARRDFRMLAMAWSPDRRMLLDPHGGRSDLERGLLAPVGSPAACLAAEPLRALRAARLVAQHGYAIDAGLEQAVTCLASDTIRSIGATGLRGELKRLLLGPHAGRALGWLRQTGVEAALGAQTRPDAPALVDALPADLALRLAAWLRGAGGAGVLRRLRMGHPLSGRVLLLLQHHPIEQSVPPQRRTAVRRLARRLDPAALAALILLRRCELELSAAANGRTAQRAGAALDALERTFAELAAAETSEREAVRLALDGEDVMKLLDIGPGPEVGRALRFLREEIAREPGHNSPDGLRALLEHWQAGPGRSTRNR